MEGKLIVFDVDDTLYLERDYVKSGFQAVDLKLQKTLGIEGFFDYAWEAFTTGTRGNTFQQVLSQLGVSFDDELIKSLVKYYRNHTPNIQLAEDARATLDAIPAGAHIGIVTDGPAESQWAKIKALRLERYDPKIIVTADRGVDWHKPSVKPFIFLQQAAGVTGNNCVYIADNPQKDFIGPEQLGWKTIRIRRVGGIYQEPSIPGQVDLGVSRLSIDSISEVFLA